MPPRRSRKNAPRRALIRRRRLIRNPTVLRSVVAKQPVHYFKRTAFYSGYLSGSTTADVGQALIGQLNQVPGYTEFTALFDQFKILAMKIRLSPRANSSEVGTNQGIVKLFSAIDYDGGTAPTVIADLLQYESLKTTKSTQDHVRYFKPRFNSPTITAGSNRPGRGWLDCDTAAAVAHHGLKLVLQQLPAGAQSFDIYVTYYLAFKNVV